MATDNSPKSIESSSTARRSSLPAVIPIHLAEQDEADNSPKSIERVSTTARRSSLPAVVPIHSEGQDGEDISPKSIERLSTRRISSLPAVVPIHSVGQDGEDISPKSIERVSTRCISSLPAVVPIHSDDGQDGEAKSPTSSKQVSTERRSSLPAAMSIHPEEQDGGAMLPVEKLEVLEIKEINIVFENKTAYFDCKIHTDLHPTVRWYRNGELMKEDYRTMIRNDGAWQRLRLLKVQVFDHGLYILECKLNDKLITVPFHLHVIPRGINKRVFHNTLNYSKMGVERHLRNVKVFKGQTIEMFATFFYEAEKYLWFKNNNELYHDSRTTTLTCETLATLSIKDSTTTDTGIYYVIAITKNGYFSSFADVIVTENEENNPFLPSIEEQPPEDIEGSLGNEIRFCAKVQIDGESVIQWMHNDTLVGTDKARQIDYGISYIGLMIPSPDKSSAGKYTLLMGNYENEKIVQADLHLTLTEPPQPYPGEIRVVRKLESAVACCGAQVTFDCCFDLENRPYFYVVWYVGRFRVERTNTLFRVICGQGQFILYIKSFEPAMAGEVICELRKSNHNRSSVKVQRTYANLTCVPPCLIQNLKANLKSKLIIASIVNSQSSYEVQSPSTSRRDVENARPCWITGLFQMCPSSLTLGCGLNRSASAELESQQEEATSSDDNSMLQIIFCKLDEDGMYFLNSTTYGSYHLRVPQIHIFDKYDTDYQVFKTIVEWQDKKPDVWYRIKMQLQDGIFADMGVTDKPSFEIQDLPINRIMVFIIEEKRPSLNMDNSLISIILTPIDFSLVPPNVEIEHSDDFEETFSRTDHIIGAGAFGSVMLVHNKKNHCQYAAKIVKARIGKQRENVYREFNIMKTLAHPKIIRLFGFYEMPLKFVFVMEYCWGGELFDRVVVEECMKELDVVRYVRQICAALHYLDLMGIVHLDIKPENIICISPNSTEVKIIDFGLAQSMVEDSPHCVYGTKEYLAPEILEYEPISYYSDMWSLGVVTYVLLSGLMPFAGNNWLERSISITRVKYDYNDDAFNEVSHLAREFVDRLLVRIPEHRMSAEEALNHCWLKEGPPRGTVSKHMAKMRMNMKNYLIEFKQRWQRIGNVMKAARRLRMLVHPNNH